MAPHYDFRCKSQDYVSSYQLHTIFLYKLLYIRVLCKMKSASHTKAGNVKKSIEFQIGSDCVGIRILVPINALLLLCKN